MILTEANELLLITEDNGLGDEFGVSLLLRVVDPIERSSALKLLFIKPEEERFSWRRTLDNTADVDCFVAGLKTSEYSLRF